MEKSTYETIILTETEYKNIIQLKDVSIGYGKSILLRDINFGIPKNNIVALLGLNGTGKSSLLRSIAGLQKIMSGSVLLNEKSIQHYSAEALAKQLGIVLSGRGELLQSLSVREVLYMARAPYTGFMHVLQQEDKRIIDDVITEFNLEGFVNRPIYQLSDGEMQKVMIARVLIQETPVIILDEPTSHLDILNKVEIFSRIKKLRSQNKTILFASHELDLALQIADYCILLNHKGEYIFGDTQSLIDNKQLDYFFNAPNFKFDAVNRKFETNLRY